VIIVAGLGGETGSKVTPVVASIARQMGCDTGAVVTKPFPFEGKKALVKYQEARQALRVDRLIEIPMWEVLVHCREAKSLRDLFRAGDAVVAKGVEALLRPPPKQDDALSLAG
jgi:cell division protein FtsZ